MSTIDTSSPSNPFPTSLPSSPTSPTSKIPTHILVSNEIVNTESTFVTGLQSLVQIYVKPLALTGTSIIPVLVQKQIFSNVETLLAFNSNLMYDLQKDRDENPDQGRNIGKIFKTFAPSLKTYTTYLENFESALKLVSDLLETNDSFRKFVESAQSDPRCKGLSLSSYLIMPVQRVPRYKMLLDELLKQILKPDNVHDRSDVDSLKIALNLVGSAAKHNNEMIRRRENQDKLISIQQSFEPGTKLTLMDSASRHFIKEGLLTKLSRRAPQPHTFWLFNDLLVYGDQKSNGTYHINRIIQLSKCQVSASSDVKEDRESGNNSVECMINIESSEKSFVCVAESLEDRVEWVKAINEAILETRKQFEDDTGRLAAIWKPDRSAQACTLCIKKFSWTFRKHHCRNCGSVVCGDCSGGSALLKHIDEKNHVRVCDECVSQGVGQSSKRSSMDLRSSMRSSFSSSVGGGGSSPNGDSRVSSMRFSLRLGSSPTRKESAPPPMLTGQAMLSMLRLHEIVDLPLPRCSPSKPANARSSFVVPAWAKNRDEIDRTNVINDCLDEEKKGGKGETIINNEIFII